jgi:hypothetical protein
MLDVLLAFIIGGIVFSIALITILLYFFNSMIKRRSRVPERPGNFACLPDEYSSYIRLKRSYDVGDALNVSSSTTFHRDSSSLPQDVVYAVITRSTLAVYSNDLKKILIDVISLQDYKMSLLPTDIRDFEHFDKSFPIQLLCRTDKKDRSFYIHACSNIEKEDWILHLSVSCRSNNIYIPPSYVMDATNFLGAKPSKVIVDEGLWFNAILSRIFLVGAVRKGMRDRIPKPSYISSITLSHFSIDSMPLFSKWSFIKATETNEVVIIIIIYL